MQANRMQTPEQRLAQDLGLTTADLERVVRDQRARDRAGKLVEALRAVRHQAVAGMGTLDENGTAIGVEDFEYIEQQARTILAEIDATIGGAA